MALSLLQIVDNPRQDVALIAALRSPVYGFSGDQLALLRAEGGGTSIPLWSRPPAGGPTCRDFLTELEELRLPPPAARPSVPPPTGATMRGPSKGGGGGGGPGRPLTPGRGVWRRLGAGLSPVPVAPGADAPDRGTVPVPPQAGRGGGVTIMSIHRSGVGETGGAAVRPVPAAEPGRPPAACPLPSGAGGWAPGGWTWADGGVSHPWPARQWPGSWSGR